MCLKLKILVKGWVSGFLKTKGYTEKLAGFFFMDLHQAQEIMGDFTFVLSFPFRWLVCKATYVGPSKFDGIVSWTLILLLPGIPIYLPVPLTMHPRNLLARRVPYVGYSTCETSTICKQIDYISHYIHSRTIAYNFYLVLWKVGTSVI